MLWQIQAHAFQEPVVRTSLLASGALALSWWERLLWLILALSMLAAWLLLSGRHRPLAPV